MAIEILILNIAQKTTTLVFPFSCLSPMNTGKDVPKEKTLKFWVCKCRNIF